MARIKLTFPNKTIFETQIPLRIQDINYGGHVGNDAFLRLAHEARLLFLQSLGFTELNIEGHSLIMSDAAIVFQHEGKYPDTLKIELAADEISKTGFDLYYRLSSETNNKVIAIVKTRMVFYNYQKPKVNQVPDSFMTKLLTL